MPQSAASPAWTLVPQATAARDWAAHLPRLNGGTVAARAARQRLAGRLRSAFPDERLGQIAASLEPWWPLRPRRTQGLELVLVHPDGRREKAVLFHRVVRIGRDASCQLQLQADTVSGQHCEIRVDEEELVHAAWFDPGALPLVPPKLSIARALIDSAAEPAGR